MRMIVRAIILNATALVPLGALWIISAWERGPQFDFHWAFAFLVFVGLAEITLPKI